MRVAVIGAGGVGARRAALAAESDSAELVVVVDIDEARATSVAKPLDADVATKWRSVVGRADVDALVVSTSNDLHAPVAIAAMEAGKDVLVEKPLARTPEESKAIVDTARRTGRICQTGFTHRYYPAVWRAHERIAAGEFGRVLWTRGRYGHRGTPALAKGWFAQASISGGGTFLDNGVHFLDLFRWFMGDFHEATGFVTTAFWSEIAPVEDNGFGLFRTADGRVAALHSSWTQWEGIFSLEFGCERALITCDGGSGTRLAVTPREANGDASTTTIEEFSVPAGYGWQRDWEEFERAVATRQRPVADAEDGWRAVELAYAIYRANERGETQRLDA